MNEIYGYNGKSVVQIASSSNGPGGTFDHRIVVYKKKGVVKVHDWHNSYSADVYYKWNGKTATRIASDSYNWVGPDEHSYYVDGQKTTKAKYTSRVASITKGAASTDYTSQTGWKKYK